MSHIPKFKSFWFFYRVRTFIGRLGMRDLANSIRLPGWIPEQIRQLLTSHSAIGVLVFLVRVASAALAYLVQILFARWMGPFEYGIYIYSWTWVVIVGGLADLGFATAAQRFLPHYRASNDLSLIRGFLFTAKWFPVLSGVAVCLVCLSFLFCLRELLRESSIMPLYLACFCVPLVVLATVQDGVARAHHWVMLGLVPDFILRPLAILTLGLIVLLLGVRLDATTAMSIALIGVASGAIVQRIVLSRRLSRYGAGEMQFELRRWRKVSLPVLMFFAFYLALTNIDIVMLDYFRKPEEVAVYYAASKTFALVAFVSFAVSTVSASRISEFSAKGQNDRIESYLAQAVRWTFWPSLAGVLLILAIGRPLLSLFGPHFVEGYPLLFIMAIGLIAQASTGPAETVLNMQNQQTACAQVYALSFAFSIVGCAILIPLLGGHGAALAIAGALILKSVLLFIFVKQRLSLHAFILRLPAR